MTSLAHISARQKTLVMVGVSLALLLYAIDQTIVATAMPRIVQDLHGLQHLSWVFTAYLLASTVVVPIYGKLSDIYGRKWLFVGGIVVFLIGSALSGAAQSMGQLIAFRAIQGLGGGAMLANAFAIVADLFPPAERGKWQGILGGVFGLASVVGPFAGGWLTDHASWRWNFYINLPIGLIALAAIIYLMPQFARKEGKPSIDYAGSILLAITLITLLLGFVWGGSQYAWGSWQIISLFATATVGLLGFLATEHRAKEPILPLSLFKSRVFSLSMMVVFMMGIGMFGVILYIPLFAQGVLGTTATNSGAILTPLMFGLIGASVIAGRIMSKTGRYKPLVIFGLLETIGAMGWLATMSPATTQLDLIFHMVAVGIGLGTTMPIFNIIVQNAFDRSQIGVVTASIQTFRNIGGTIGTAVLGTVFNNALAHNTGELASTNFVAATKGTKSAINFAAPNANQVQGLLNTSSQHQIVAGFAKLPATISSKLGTDFSSYIGTVKHVYSSSLTEVFLIGAGISVVAFVAGIGIPEIPLQGAVPENPDELTEAGMEIATETMVTPANHQPRPPVMPRRRVVTDLVRNSER